MRKIVVIFLLLAPFFGKSQCTEAPEFQSVIVEINDICSFQDDPYNWLMPDSTNGEPIDSIGVTMYHYPTVERDTLVLSKSTVYTDGYVDWSGMQLGYGLVAEVFALNACGVSDTVSTPIDILVGFEAEPCATDYGTQILGNTQIDFNDSSSQTYVLDSPELRAFISNNNLDQFYSASVFWELTQFEGGGYQDSDLDTLIQNGLVSDTTVVFNTLPDGKFYLVAELNICNCAGTGWGMGSVILDTLIIEKTDLQGSAAWISGQALINENGNCAGATSPISGQVVQIQPGNKYATTDENGWFGVNVEPGTYSVSLLGNSGERCDTSGVVVTVAQGDTSTITLKAKVDYTDIALNSWGRALMQRDSYTQWITIKNAGRALQGDVHCEVLENNGAQAVSLDNSSPTANSLTATTATWDDVSLGFNEEASFYMEGALENVVMNDSITAVVSYITADTTFVDTLKVLVRNSYDPNDKWVDVEEVLIADYEAEIPTLNYRIRFQNTGNDTAYTIVVRDTVRENLDISTLTLGASSHDYTFAILDSNVLEWTFEDILLPDSTTDEPGSNGFIFFDMKPKAGLAVGDVVANNADIYFDLNPPIITNFATTEITEPCEPAQMDWVGYIATSGIANIGYCEGTVNVHTLLIFRPQSEVDSFEVSVFRYINAGRTQTELLHTETTTDSSLALDVDLKFGLVAYISPINSCGIGDTAVAYLHANDRYVPYDCGNSLAPQISGPDTIDSGDNSAKMYSAGIQDLVSYLQQTDIDTGKIEWILKHQGQEVDRYSSWYGKNAILQDSTVTLENIPVGTSHLTLQVGPVCICDTGNFSSTDWPGVFELDSVIIQKISLNPDRGLVRGNVYGTDVGDCGDTTRPSSKHLVRISPTNQYFLTASDGSYAVALDSGSYNIALFSSDGELCDSSGIDFEIDNSDTVEINLATQLSSDIRVYGGGNAQMQRNHFWFQALVYNPGRSTSYELEIDVLPVNNGDAVGLTASYPDADLLEPTAASWTDRYLAYKGSEDFIVEGTLEDVVFGDSIMVISTTRASGLTVSDTTYIVVRNSYDPNDKQVSINTIPIDEYMEENPMLDYRIRFQNTGNDTAFTVVVTDTLPQELDAGSFKMGAASHDYTFHLSDNGVVRWTFEDINLPDSGTNQLASNGYILFQAKLKSNLSVGDMARNRANIFFDLNPPIITNDAVTQITTMASIQQHSLASYQLYPNPVTHRLHIQGDQQISEVQLIGLDGAVLYSAEVQRQKAIVDMSAWLPGVYFIRIVNEQGLSTTHKVVKR